MFSTFLGNQKFYPPGRPLPRGWVRFKYSEDIEYNDLVTAVRLDGLLGLVCKVTPESGRIGGSGRVNRPVRVRLPVTGRQMNSHEAPSVRVG